MNINNKLNINSKNTTTDAFTYFIWMILILSPLYVLYFLYSLATGSPIIYSTKPSVIFFIAGVITLFDIFAVHQIIIVRHWVSHILLSLIYFRLSLLFFNSLHYQVALHVLLHRIWLLTWLSYPCCPFTSLSRYRHILFIYYSVTIRIRSTERNFPMHKILTALFTLPFPVHFEIQICKYTLNPFFIFSFLSFFILPL